MKQFLITVLLAGLTVAASAQVTTQPSYSIFDALQSAAAGKGTVVVDQPASVRRMVGVAGSGVDIETRNGRSYIKTQGYRVQVFSGNNQRTSKDEAFNKEKEIKNTFPNLTTYVTYVAPFWRLRVGDYASYEEAYFAQRQIIQSFPSYAKEMYPVREDVRIPLDYTY